MKRILPAILIVCLAAVVLCACRRSYRSDLERVDSVLSADIPDTVEAHRLLDSVGASAGSFSEADRMYYIMLWADLQNKSFAPLPGDSLMRTMVGYYDRHGSANERMRAYYLLGSFYRDRNSQVEAQENFHKAVEAADTAAPDCNFRLLARVYGQLADLYRHRTDLAVDMYNSAKYYALKGRDTSMSITVADNLIECYRDMHRHDTIIGIARWCQAMYERIGYPEQGNSLWLALADAYVERSDFDSAAYCLHRYEQTSDMADDDYNVRPGMNRESYYTYKGDYYLAKGQTDSALIFYYKELHTNKEPYVLGGSQDLYRTYKRIGNKDSVIKYQTLYIRYRERRASKEAVSQLQELQVHFDVNRERARTEKYQGRTRLLLSVVAVLVLGWVAWLFYAYRRNRRNRRKREDLADTIYRLECERADNIRQIEQMKGDKTERDLHIERLTAELHRTEKIIEAKEGELRRAEKRLHGAGGETAVATAADKSRIIGDICRMAEKKISINSRDDLWDVFLDYAREQAPMLIQLVDGARLPGRDVRICLMVWAHFSPKTMCVLLSMSKQNIASARSRLYRKIWGEEGTSQDFDERIRRIAPYPFDRKK